MSCEGVIMKYQLHDCEIDAIVLENNRIIFSFPDGFYVTDENGQELAPLRNKLVFVIDKETNESLESYVSVRRIKRGRRGWKEISFMIDIVKKSKRAVFIQGITPSGRTGYFGFGV